MRKCPEEYDIKLSRREVVPGRDELSGLSEELSILRKRQKSLTVSNTGGSGHAEMLSITKHA